MSHLEEYAVRPKFMSAEAAAIFIQALGLPPPQAAALDGVEWIVIPPNKVFEEAAPEWSTHAASVRVWEPFTVLLYGSEMNDRVSPSTSLVVWDSRRFPGLVPATVRHPADGRELRLMGLTRQSVQAWPVRRGDHVFVALTETRAMQRARLVRDAMIEHTPDEWRKILESYDGNDDEACASYATAMVAAGTADLTTANDGWLAELGEPESRLPEEGPASPQDLYLSALLPWLQTGPKGQGKRRTELRSFMVRAHYARSGDKIHHTDWYDLRRGIQLDEDHAASWTNTSYRHLSVIACLMWIGLDVVFDEVGKPGSAVARADDPPHQLRAVTLLLLKTPFGLSDARVLKEHATWTEGEAWFKAHCMDRRSPPVGHAPLTVDLIEHTIEQLERAGVTIDEIEEAFQVPPLPPAAN